ncbi:MAG: T9SS type A sorting domain-containing protein [Bacteroidia bacterium]|nr:T9SS type A sorting domain-containing protein [Bacteroidia bacterium]
MATASFPPEVSDEEACYGDAIPALTAIGDDVKWYSDSLLINILDSGNTYNPPVPNAGTYIYYVTQLGPCGESPAEPVVLTIHALPELPIAHNQAICHGDSVPSLTADGYNILWYNHFTLPYVINTGNIYNTGDDDIGVHTYYITQSDSITGCTSNATTISLTIQPSPLITLNNYNFYITQGESVTIKAYNAVTYTWEPVDGSLNTTIGSTVFASPDSTTVYTVIGTNSIGCSGTASCTVHVDEDAISEIETEESLLISPNPTEAKFRIEYNSLQQSPIQVHIRNTHGQILVVKEIYSINGKFNHVFDIGNFADGMYHVQIVTEKGIINRKVVLRQVMNNKR